MKRIVYLTGVAISVCIMLSACENRKVQENVVTHDNYSDVETVCEEYLNQDAIYAEDDNLRDQLNTDLSKDEPVMSEDATETELETEQTEIQEQETIPHSNNASCDSNNEGTSEVTETTVATEASEEDNMIDEDTIVDIENDLGDF